MRSVRIVCDSTSDLPQDLLNKLELDVIPLKIHFSNDVFHENETLTATDFYQRIKQTNIIPRTAPPDLSRFIEIFQRWAPTHDILSIHLSAFFSETVKIASQARDQVYRQFPDARIQILDSQSTSMAYGFQVLAAHDAAAMGQDLKKIEQELIKVKPRIYAFFTVGSLTYLRMGGRLGNLKAILPTMLGKRGILTIKDGEIKLLGRVEQDADMVEAVFQHVQQLIPAEMKIKAVVLDTNTADKGDALAKMIQSHYDCQQFYRSIIGPVVGVHTGLGTFACVIQTLD